MLRNLASGENAYSSAEDPPLSHDCLFDSPMVASYQNRTGDLGETSQLQNAPMLSYAMTNMGPPTFTLPTAVVDFARIAAVHECPLGTLHRTSSIRENACHSTQQS